jgi:Zn finger protein HypA/HybF involved in hydrogenase expression
MNREEIKFCPQCGGNDLATREITPNHILELYCPHCGAIAMLLWFDRALVGSTAEHDPDSDAESW